MATPIFKDKAVLTDHVATWPESPDREQDGLGRAQYAQPTLQKALHSDPSQKINLSAYSDFLKDYQPDQHGLYQKDPVSALIEKVADKNLFFEDDTFPPSMWKDGKNGLEKYGRIKELISSPKMYILDTENDLLFSMNPYDTPPNLLTDPARSPAISDMNQERLANCGFVATIGALALHPQAHNLLFSTIYPAVYNPLGIYSIRLIINSEVRYLLIDDQIPNEGYSSMKNTSEFWYLLIEKAFAKLNKGYLRLGGEMERYFGIESSANININQDNKHCVWKDYFLYYYQHKQSTTYQGTGSNTTRLVKIHAYSIIDAAEWSGFKLVRLHNPWNRANYTDSFSPSSSQDWNRIPQAIQKELFQVNRFKKTTFWIPYEYYIRDIPKISNLYLNEKIPRCLKAIAKASSIQASS